MNTRHDPTAGVVATDRGPARFIGYDCRNRLVLVDLNGRYVVLDGARVFV